MSDNFNGFDSFKAKDEAIQSVISIDKEIQKEVSKGLMGDKKKIAKMRFEQMLRGLYITQNPMNIN